MLHKIIRVNSVVYSRLKWLWKHHLVTSKGFPGSSAGKKYLPAMQETPVWFLGWEDPLEEYMATHSNILVWRSPWTEEPGGFQSIGLKRVGHNWSDLAWKHAVSTYVPWMFNRLSNSHIDTHTHTHTHTQRLSITAIITNSKISAELSDYLVSSPRAGTMCPSSLFFGLTNIIQYLSVQLSLSILGGLDPDSPRIPKPMGAKVPQLFPISMDSASADMMADCVFIEKVCM